MQVGLSKFNPSYFMSIMLTVLLVGCGAGAGNDSNTSAFTEPLTSRPAPRSCSIAGINTWVHESMQDYYLFYDQIDRNIDPAAFDSPEQFMRELRVQPNDTFSYVTDEVAYNAFFSEGETFGYGWNFARDGDNTLLFALVEPNSPLALAGVERGEELVSINDIDIDDFTAMTSIAQNDILGVGDQVKTIDLVVADAAQQPRQVTVTKATYDVQTVLDSNVISRNAGNVAYLHFYQFISTSSDELEEAFSFFNDTGVTELVLDLRFNGGGRISVANELASYIIGPDHGNDVFATFALNDKYQHENAGLNFRTMAESLSLNRVFVLQSDNTCSASELVVNSLRPFIEVITVGETSCGKPYASSPNFGCEKVVNALEYELLNADGAGGYFNGIAADCPVQDNVRTALGDTSEPLLAEALNYIDTGSCALMARNIRHNSHRLTNEFKQAWRGGNTL